jgi:chromosomal replication initiation ATPase DnaA
MAEFYGFARDRAAARLAMDLAAYACAVEPVDVSARTRGSAEAAAARQLAMYLAHVATGMSLSRVAYAFGRDRSTVAHACRAIEDRRDDPAFDAQVEMLEDVLREAPPPGGVAQLAMARR